MALLRKLMLSGTSPAETGSEPLGARGRLLQFVSGSKLAERMMRDRTAVQPIAMHRVVAEAMTIKETCFFRDAALFKLLSQRILPEIIERNRSKRSLRLWSAGCATGQETYSLAMMLCEQFPELEDWDVRVEGTDVSRQACTYARRGQFTRFEMNRGLPVRYMLKYFKRNGESWRVNDSVRRRVRFRCTDLREPNPRMYDLVLLRHVLLHLHPAERVRVLAGVYFSMSPSARLVLGASEQVEYATGLFEEELVEEQCFYRPVTASRN